MLVQLRKTALLLVPLLAHLCSAGASPRIHTINVGKGDHKFQPEAIEHAEVGDIIEFRFYPQNHSVVRAEFEHPCVPFETINRGSKGLFSGFFPVADIRDDVSLLDTKEGKILTDEITAAEMANPNQRHQAHLLLLLRSQLMYRVPDGRRHQPRKLNSPFTHLPSVS